MLFLIVQFLKSESKSLSCCIKIMGMERDQQLLRCEQLGELVEKWKKKICLQQCSGYLCNGFKVSVYTFTFLFLHKLVSKILHQNSQAVKH